MTEKHVSEEFLIKRIERDTSQDFVSLAVLIF